MYFFFTETWQLNVLKIVLLYTPRFSTLEVAVSDLNYSNVYNRGSQLSVLFSLPNPILNGVTVKTLKSEKPVSKTLLRWNRLRRFVSISSIHVCLSGFSKHVVSLIKLFRQFTSQKAYICQWIEIEFYWGLYEQFRNHFLFLKLISAERLLYCNAIYGVMRPSILN